MKTIVHTARNEKPITELYVVLSRDKEGNEGICAFRMEDQMQWMAVCHDPKVFELMKAMFKNAPKQNGMELVCIKFTHKEELGNL